MSPQLTLQTPLQLPPSEIPSYLAQLWANDQADNLGANTFSMLIWQPAWLEQKLVKIEKIKGPIIGNQRNEIIEAARQVVLDRNLPHSTPPLDKTVAASLPITDSYKNINDLRGQHIDSAISELQPRRLITLAPTIDQPNELETLVAAYCPLPEEGGGNSACGDVVVLRGDINALNSGLSIVDNLVPEDLPSWLWWNGSLDEAPDLLNKLALKKRRIILDTALGDPFNCLETLEERIKTGQAVNDLNWLRLRSWRETLAMVFDPPNRRDNLNHVVKLDIDIQGHHPAQGLLLVAWIANRLNWTLKECHSPDKDIIEANFLCENKTGIKFCLHSLPVGNPSIHPGQIVGLRLICKPNNNPSKGVCVILASESGECMRLEAGGMASMELLEEVVPLQNSSTEMDVARLLGSSRGSTSPLLSSAAPLAKKLLEMASTSLS